MKDTQKIAIIGAGNLGKAIALGVVNNGNYSPKDILLTRRDSSKLMEMKKLGYQLVGNKEAVKKAGIVVLCVQPNQLKEVLAEVKQEIREDHIIISVITGVSIEQIAGILNKPAAIVRAMPNTAIAIGESMTCIASSSTSGLDTTKALFDSLGKTLVIDEDLMQAATVLGASGVAFFMRYIRAATQGGVQMGFDSADAQLIAMQTAKGAASLVLENDSHPEVEIDKVTTPQGCTIEGLNEMEHKGFSSALIQGIMTSYYRITKMKKG